MITHWSVTILWIALLMVTPARGDDLGQLQATFESAVAALNAGNIDGFLLHVHDKALSFYSCGPTVGG